MVILEDIFEFFQKLFKGVFNFIQIFKLNCQIYSINKNKNKVFKELGIIVYEFYNVDKNLIGDEEVESLINEIKDYEIEIDELEKMIESIKNPDMDMEEKDEISNKVLLENSDKEEKESVKNETENNRSSSTTEESK